jgi:hypothetical protein
MRSPNCTSTNFEPNPSNPTKFFLTASTLAALLFACGSQEHKHDSPDAEHSHSDGVAHGHDDSNEHASDTTRTDPPDGGYEPDLGYHDHAH